MITYASSFSACKSCGIQSKALDKSVNTAPIKIFFKDSVQFSITPVKKPHKLRRYTLG